MAGISRSKSVLEVADLELVLALSEAGSTVRASATLHLTQSAVSRALLAVEDKLGTRLFERKARGLELTAPGRRFVGAAGPVLAQLTELEQHVRTGRSGTAPLRIVCECYTAYRWLPDALHAMQRALGTELTVAIGHTETPVAALLAGDVDVALVTTAKVPKTLVEAPLFHDEIVFLVAATHPLAERGALTVQDLEEHPLIVSTATPEPERLWFMRQLFGRSTPRMRRLQFPLTEVILDATRAGMGVAAMSEWVARPYLATGDLVARRLRGKQLKRPWRIAYRPDVAASARQLATALQGAPPRVFTRA